MLGKKIVLGLLRDMFMNVYEFLTPLIRTIAQRNVAANSSNI